MHHELPDAVAIGGAGCADEAWKDYLQSSVAAFLLSSYAFLH